MIPSSFILSIGFLKPAFRKIFVFAHIFLIRGQEILDEDFF
jgi:hypothetical protein